MLVVYPLFGGCDREEQTLTWTCEECGNLFDSDMCDNACGLCAHCEDAMDEPDAADTANHPEAFDD